MLTFAGHRGVGCTMCPMASHHWSCCNSPWGTELRRRRDCHSAAPPLPCGRCLNMDGEGVSLCWCTTTSVGVGVGLGVGENAILLHSRLSLWYFAGVSNRDGDGMGSAILLHPPLRLSGVSIGMERGGVSKMTELSPTARHGLHRPRPRPRRRPRRQRWVRRTIRPGECIPVHAANVGCPQ